MELKEYLQIFRKNAKLFLAIVLVPVFLSLLYFYFQPISYNTSLTINVTRLGLQETADYRYDDFYRLQADERFAETIVEWMKSPRVVADIYADAKIDLADFSLAKLSKNFSAERRSSQIVEVRFSSSDPKQAQKISASIVKIISENISKLNESQKEANWFKIVSGDPVTAKNVPNYKIIILASLLAGIFLGFWVVMIKYYLE